MFYKLPSIRRVFLENLLEIKQSYQPFQKIKSDADI